MRIPALPLGAFLTAAAVAAGAFGAHGLRTVLPADRLALWETAVRYALIGAAGLMVAGLAERLLGGRGWRLSALLLGGGVVVFSATVGALALGAPRWLGAITPLGGVMLIGGFVALGVAGLRRGDRALG